MSTMEKMEKAKEAANKRASELDALAEIFGLIENRKNWYIPSEDEENDYYADKREAFDKAIAALEKAFNI